MPLKLGYPLSVVHVAVAASLLCVSVNATSQTPTDVQSARTSLASARVTLTKTVAEFRTLLENNGLNETEKEDYLTYIDRLKQVVEDNCKSILAMKSVRNDNTPERGCEAVGSSSGAVSFPGEETEDERVATTEDQLNSSMSEFDEFLLREMEELERKRSSATNGSGSAGAADRGGQQTGDENGSGETSNASTGEGESGQSGSDEQGQAQTASRDNQDGQQQSGSHGGSQTNDPSGGTAKRDEPPADSDDDIVARQLREAAENETDPELREKLWEEYRRYKGDSASKSN